MNSGLCRQDTSPASLQDHHLQNLLSCTPACGSHSDTLTLVQEATTLAGGSSTPGRALTEAFRNMMRATEQRMVLLPLAAESLGEWHQVGELATTRASLTGEVEGEGKWVLFQRLQVLLIS